MTVNFPDGRLRGSFSLAQVLRMAKAEGTLLATICGLLTGTDRFGNTYNH